LFSKKDYAALSKFVVVGQWPTLLGGVQPLFVVRAGLSNTKELMQQVEPETMQKFMLFHRERIFQQIDKATRETKRLVKSYTVNDLNFVSVSNMQDKRFSKALGGASAMSEKMYPQMLEAAVMINVPRIFAALFSFFKLFLPKRTLAKIKVCPGRTLTQPLSKCPFVRARGLAAEELPVFLGGTGTTPDGYFGGVPLQATAMADAVGPDGLATKVVKAGKRAEVVYPVTSAGCVFMYELEVEAHGIQAEALFVPEQGPEVALVPMFKHKAEGGPAKGRVKVPGTSGVVKLVLDNSYSYTTAKTVRYDASVVDGDVAQHLEADT